jgi:hypothetical protein
MAASLCESPPSSFFYGKGSDAKGKDKFSASRRQRTPPKGEKGGKGRGSKRANIASPWSRRNLWASCSTSGAKSTYLQSARRDLRLICGARFLCVVCAGSSVHRPWRPRSRCSRSCRCCICASFYGGRLLLSRWPWAEAGRARPRPMLPGPGCEEEVRKNVFCTHSHTLARSHGGQFSARLCALAQRALK